MHTVCTRSGAFSWARFVAPGLFWMRVRRYRVVSKWRQVQSQGFLNVKQCNPFILCFCFKYEGSAGCFVVLEKEREKFDIECCAYTYIYVFWTDFGSFWLQKMTVTIGMFMFSFLLFFWCVAWPLVSYTVIQRGRGRGSLGTIDDDDDDDGKEMRKHHLYTPPSSQIS